MDGEAVPVFYRGRQIGERRRYDIRLLITALRQWSPDRPGNLDALADFLGSSLSDARRGVTFVTFT